MLEDLGSARSGDGIVLVVTRYEVPPAGAVEFLGRAREALAVLAAQPGFRGGRVGRATDEPRLWALTCEWESVGAYRRALGSYEVKVGVVPLMYGALDEPTAFEVLLAEGSGGAVTGATRRAADADEVGVGQTAGPRVRTDLG